MASQQTASLIPSGLGTAWWLFGARVSVQVGREQSAGLYTLVELRAPSGWCSPWHVHRLEDETVLLREGVLRIECGTDSWDAEPGATIFLPRGVPHVLLVASPEPVIAWQITTPAGYEDLIAALGERESPAGLPPPTMVDTPDVVEVAAVCGVDIIRVHGATSP